MLAIVAAWSNGVSGELAVLCGPGCPTIVTRTAAQTTTATAASARLERTKVLASGRSRRQAARTVSRWWRSSLGGGTALCSA